MKIKAVDTVEKAQALLDQARVLNNKGVQAVLGFEGSDVGMAVSSDIVKILLRDTQRKLNKLKKH